MSSKRSQVAAVRTPVARRCHGGAPPPSSKAQPNVSATPSPNTATTAPPTSPQLPNKVPPGPLTDAVIISPRSSLTDPEGEVSPKAPAPVPQPRVSLQARAPTPQAPQVHTVPAPQQQEEGADGQAFYGEWNSPAETPRDQPPPAAKGGSNGVYKGLTMELEKLEIQNQNLRDKLDTLQLEKRDQERQMRELGKDLDDSNDKIRRMEDGNTYMQDKMADLKLQVREELTRNEKLDQQLQSLEHVQESLAAKDQRVAELEKQLHETQLLLQYSKKAFSKEHTKNKELQKMLEDEKKARKYDELIVMENETLKGLITAKDSMLTHKSRLIETVKSLVKQYPGVVDTGIIKHALNSDPRALANAQDSHNGMGGQQKGRFLESFLGSSERKKVQRAASARSTRIRPQTPQTQTDTFSDFRSGSPDSGGHYQAYKREQVIVKKTLAKDEKPPPKNGYTIRRWQTVKVVPASNGSNDAPGSGSTSPRGQQRPRSAYPNASPLRRSQTLRNTLRPPTATSTYSDVYATDTSYYDESGPVSRKTSTTTVTPATPSTRCTSLSNGGELDASVNSRLSYTSTMEKDIMYLRALKVGDRVIVDTDKSKDDKKGRRRGGIIKFIGQVDKARDSGRLYTGIRLDEPVGDSDGVFNSKRYFHCTENHGIFLKVTAIVKVFNKDRSGFSNIEERISQLRAPPRHMDMASLV